MNRKALACESWTAQDWYALQGKVSRLAAGLLTLDEQKAVEGAIIVQAEHAGVSARGTPDQVAFFKGLIAGWPGMEREEES